MERRLQCRCWNALPCDDWGQPKKLGTVSCRFSHPTTKICASRTGLGFFFFVLSDLNGAAGLDVLILELLSDMGCLFQELKLSGSLVC